MSDNPLPSPVSGVMIVGSLRGPWVSVMQVGALPAMINLVSVGLSLRPRRVMIIPGRGELRNMTPGCARSE